MLSIAASASAIRCGNKNVNITPAPSLANGPVGEIMKNREPIYSRVIVRDILVKTRGKVLFSILNPTFLSCLFYSFCSIFTIKFCEYIRNIISYCSFR